MNKLTGYSHIQKIIKRTWIALLVILPTFTFLCQPQIEAGLSSLIQNENQLPIQEILNRQSQRVYVLFEGTEWTTLKKTATLFYHRLNLSDYASVTGFLSSTEQRQRVQSLLPYRGGLLSEEDEALLHQERYHDLAQQRIDQLGSFAPTLVPIKQDPFGLLTHYLYGLMKIKTGWRLKDGFLWRRFHQKQYLLMTLDLKKIESVSFLKKQVEAFPENGVQVFLSGAPVHTYTTMQKSQMELNVFAGLSLLCMMLISFSLLKKKRYLGFILLNLGLSFVWGCGVLGFFFDQIHILTFVFGTSLIGLTIDYSFHYFTTSHHDKKTMYRNMGQALLTTLFCFVPFLFSGISLLQQIACFTIASLLSVFFNIVFFYPKVQRDFSTLSPQQIGKKDWHFVLPLSRLLHSFHFLHFFRFLNFFRFSSLRPYLFAVAVAVCLYGLPQMATQTTLMDLYRPNPKNAHAEQKFSEIVGQDYHSFLIIKGANLEAALQTGEQMKISEGILRFLPSYQKQLERYQLVQKLYQSESSYLKEKLKINPVQADFTPLTEQVVSEWVRPFILRQTNAVYLIIPLTQPYVGLLPNNAFVVQPKQMVQQTLAHYAHKIYWGLLVTGSGVFLFLAFLYRRKVVSYLVPPILSVCFVLSLLSLSGVSINLFHLLSLFVVVGVGIDYAVFNLNGGNRYAVFCSFLTSLIGFGLLAFAEFTLISSMGLVLAMGLSFSYLFSLKGENHETMV